MSFLRQSAFDPTKTYEVGTKCKQPIRHKYGKGRCRNCTGCREYRLNDYVGRCLAEQVHTGRAVAVTLTYGTLDPHADFLVYRDVQLLLKRMRKAGYKVRYIVAGEHGSKKGRAHWHMILFLNGDKLEILNADGNPVHINPHGTEKKDVVNEHWPLWSRGQLPYHGPLLPDQERPIFHDYIGHCHFQPADRRGFRYLLKYILKDTTEEHRASHFALSKKPLLGFQYLSNLATSYAKAGHLPASPTYDIGRKRHWLASSARDAFLRVYAAAYFAAHGHTPRILPEWAQNTVRQPWPLQNLFKEKWHGYFSDAAQGVQVQRTEFLGPLRPFFGPLDKDGYHGTTTQTLCEPFDWRDAVGKRRLEYEAVSRLVCVETIAAPGIYHVADSCECRACQIRRQTTPELRWYKFQTPPGFFPLAQRPKARIKAGTLTDPKAEALRALFGSSYRPQGTGSHINRGQRADRRASVASARPGQTPRTQGPAESWRALCEPPF